MPRCRVLKFGLWAAAAVWLDKCERSAGFSLSDQWTTADRIQRWRHPNTSTRSTAPYRSPATYTQPSKTRDRLPRTVLQLALNWDELAYTAQSWASSLATGSLQGGDAEQQNIWTTLPVMYGAGLLTSVSPCVYGLLPLTLSYIAQAAGERRDGQALMPTLAFAAGLATVFCSLGVVAAQVGGVMGSSSTSSGAGSVTDTLIQVVPHVICLLMGFKLLELINIPLPSLDFMSARSKTNIQSESELVLIDGTGQILSNSDATNENQPGALLRTFLLGGSSALVASPCATPVLTSILGFCASSQNPILGGTFLLSYTLGYATPLLVIASTGGQALVALRNSKGDGSGGNTWYTQLAPWVTPLTGGILLWYGTNGVLTALLGDPSLAGLGRLSQIML